ncbi:hypothetical protein RDI58_026852 [Solanum bulbocastanum]|uniref:DUF4216 domain-containing protein n=1 Tax=Solanum bulbocastanum TaxID=147425 RepID=A0AAN8T2C0_SOLBU
MEVSPSRLPRYGVEHNWTKQRMFLELPYWKDNLLSTVMDVKGKTKDNTKARMDIKEYCRRKELWLQELQNVRSKRLSKGEGSKDHLFKVILGEKLFQTEEVSRNKKTNNSGVYIQGDVDGTGQTIEYYGVIQGIIEVRYSGWPKKKIVLFWCEWFDPSHRGTKMDHQHNIIEVKHTTKYRSYDPFIIAQNAKQVLYASYPLRIDKTDWWVVIKSKPVGRIEIDNVLDVAYQNDVAIVQQEVDVELETTPPHPQHILEEVFDDDILNVEEEISENEESGDGDKHRQNLGVSQTKQANKKKSRRPIDLEDIAGSISFAPERISHDTHLFVVPFGTANPQQYYPNYRRPLSTSSTSQPLSARCYEDLPLQVICQARPLSADTPSPTGISPQLSAMRIGDSSSKQSDAMADTPPLNQHFVHPDIPPSSTATPSATPHDTMSALAPSQKDRLVRTFRL